MPTRADQRYRRAVKELEADPARELVMLTDPDDPSGNVIVSIARRGVGFIEMSCSKERYDPFGLLSLFKRHTGDDESKYPKQQQGSAYERAIIATAGKNHSIRPVGK